MTLLPLLLACAEPRRGAPGSAATAGDASTSAGAERAGAAGDSDAAGNAGGAGPAAGGAGPAAGGAGPAAGDSTVSGPLAGAPTASVGGDGGSEDCELMYRDGHGDLFVRFDGGLHLSVRSTFGAAPPEMLADTSRVCVVVPASSRALAESMGGAPESADYAFLGVSKGEPFWLLPATPRAGMPWFGASTEGAPSGRYEGDEVRVAIASLEMPAGGQLAAWSASTFGVPSTLFSTATGVLIHAFPVGAHVHFNWAFSVAGSYTVHFSVEGEHDGSWDRSPASPLRFLVER